MEALVGETVPTVTDLTVEAGKVAEFAASLRDDSQLFRDEKVARAAGYEGIPAPLTFTRVGYFPRYRPEGVGRDLGFDLGFVPERVVHGSQAYQFERPLFVGDTVRGSTTLVDVFQRETSGGEVLTFAVLETEFRTTDGELVVTTTNTRIETGGSSSETEEKRTDGGDPNTTPRNQDTNSSGDDDACGPSPVQWTGDDRLADGGQTPDPQEYAVGDSGPTLTIDDVERKDFVKYAGASGDFNRVHYNEPYAEDAGYDSVIGQGMLTAGYAARMVTEWFDLSSIRAFSIRFETPLKPDDRLTITGTVSDVLEGPTVEAEHRVVNQANETVASGEVIVDVARK